jgi:hypothetical protein
MISRHGELALTYFSTMRVARYGDVIEGEMLKQLLVLMTHKSVTDGGVKILKLAASWFFFTADMVGNLIALMKDSVSRAEVACALLPRVVDSININTQTYDVLVRRHSVLASVTTRFTRPFSDADWLRLRIVCACRRTVSWRRWRRIWASFFTSTLSIRQVITRCSSRKGSIASCADVRINSSLLNLMHGPCDRTSLQQEPG